MKKQYNTPKSQLINIAAEGFLCTSGTMGAYEEETTSGWSNNKDFDWSKDDEENSGYWE